MTLVGVEARCIVLSLLALVGVLTACSGGEEQESSASNAAATTATPTTAVPTTEVPASATSVVEPEAIVGSSSALIPARPSPNDGSSEDRGVEDGNSGVWLGRGTMSAESIQLFWSAPADASIYSLFRIDRAGETEPDSAELDEADLLYRGPEVGYVDERVEPAGLYWYILLVEHVDGTNQQRWTMADAVTDLEPPSTVRGLEVERIDDTIRLDWIASSDNYQFARYAIRRSVDGADFAFHGNSFDVNQTSFVDDQLPNAATVAYEVISVDFHDNRSTPAVVTVDLN